MTLQDKALLLIKTNNSSENIIDFQRSLSKVFRSEELFEKETSQLVSGFLLVNVLKIH